MTRILENPDPNTDEIPETWVCDRCGKTHTFVDIVGQAPHGWRVVGYDLAIEELHSCPACLLRGIVAPHRGAE